MATFGVTVQLGQWRAVVHRRTCTWYRRSAHKSVPVPPGAAVVLCGTCDPTEAEVRADPPFVEFYEHGRPNGTNGFLRRHGRKPSRQRRVNMRDAEAERYRQDTYGTRGIGRGLQ